MEKKFKAQDKLNQRRERKTAREAAPAEPPISPEEISDDLKEV